MSLTEEQITAQNFKLFYEALYPYLNGAAHAGFTPVGTVIAYYGETAPQNYLACDGTAYNKVDYPELWTHLSSLSDTTPYVVDGDNTKFKVPDLQGEFLRGSGTNSHANQGSGANVGEHQDGTSIPSVEKYTGGSGLAYSANASTNLENPDFVQYMSSYKYFGNGGSSGSQENTPNCYTSRPTNTSVLWCIATKDIYVDARFDYSTTEKVIGTWIDGKPVYQKTITGLNISTADEWLTIGQAGGIDKVINGIFFSFSPSVNISWQAAFKVQNETIYCYLYGWLGVTLTDCMIQYTKTTD